MTARHVREIPTGELTWTDHITLLPIFACSGFHEGIDWSMFPDFPGDADEWALWRCIDAAGNHWTRVGDARVLRAAFPLPAVVGAGETVTVTSHWWVDGIPYASSPGLLAGWFD